MDFSFRQLKNALKRFNGRLFLRALPGLLLCLSLLTLSVCNFPAIYRMVQTGVDLDTPEILHFHGIGRHIRDFYKSDELWGKYTLIDLNGLFARLSGRRHDNGVDRMANGMLSEYIDAPVDTGENVRELEAFSAYLRGRRIPFLYVQAPGKTDLEARLLSPYALDYTNANADALVDALDAEGVACLDLRPDISATPEAVEQNFYRTDHHWNPHGAFIGFQRIMTELDALTETRLDMGYTDQALWTVHRFPRSFLGSRGKRVGRFFGGVDDLLYYTPNFDTRMSTAILNHQEVKIGAYEEACLFREYAERRDFYALDNYCVYYGGNYPLMRLRNPDAPNPQRLLVIKESFALPLLSFLQTEFREVDALDPRYYTDSSIVEYVEMSKPDLVMEMVNASAVNSREFYRYGLEAAAVNTAGVWNEHTVWKSNRLEFEQAENASPYAVLPVALSPGRRYSIGIDSKRLKTGDAQSLLVGVFDTASGRCLCDDIWVFSQNPGPFTWSFLCPQIVSGRMELRVYAGMPGETADAELLLFGLSVAESSTMNGLFALDVCQNGLMAADETGWNSLRLNGKLIAGASYLLRGDGLRVTEGETEIVAPALFNRATGQFEMQTEWVPDGGSRLWYFTVPVWLNADDLELRVYAGRPGEPAGVGLAYDEIALLQMDRPFGDLVYNKDYLDVFPASSNWNSTVSLTELRPGKTYTVSAGEIEIRGGDSTVASVALFNRQDQTVLASIDWPLREDEHRWTFTVPDDPALNGDLILLFYAGKMGNTARRSATYHNVFVHEWTPRGQGDVIYTREKLSLSAANNAYNNYSLPLDLQPGHSYRVSIDDYALTNGSPASVTACLYSEKYGLILDTATWWVNGGHYRFSWDFTVPEDLIGSNEAALQLYAGPVGKTKWIGVDFFHISVQELTKSAAGKGA